MPTTKGKIYLGDQLISHTLTDIETETLAFEQMNISDLPYCSSKAPTSLRPVQPGYCLSFDGVNDYISIGGVSDYTFFNVTGVFTFGAWVKLTDHTADDAYIIFGNNGTASAATGVALLYENRVSQGSPKKLRFFLGKGTGGGIYISSTASSDDIITDNLWHYVTVTGDGSAVTFYVDGVADVTASYTSALGGTNASYSMQLGMTNSILPFDGNMSGVFISDAEATAAQVLGLSNGVTPFTPYRQYNLSESSGTIAYDSSGNSNNGTLVNGPTWTTDNSLPYSWLNQVGYSNAQNLINFSSMEPEAITGGYGTGRYSKTLDGDFTKLERTSVGGSSYVGDYISESSVGDYMMEFTVKAGVQSTNQLQIGTLQGSWQGDYIEIVSGAGNITVSSGLYKVEDLDQNETVIRVKLPNVTGHQFYIYPLNTGAGTIGDVMYIKNNLHVWEGDENAVKPPYVDTAPIGHTIDAGITSVFLPRDEADITKDVYGNDLQHSGTAFPVPPVKRNSYSVMFDGVDDRIDTSTNHLARPGDIIEMDLKINWQAGQVTQIIASNHASNNSTCFAPHLRLFHDVNELRFYGCRGAPFPFWSIDASFYGEWRHIKLEVLSTGYFLTIDDGERRAIDMNSSSTGDWGGVRDTYWAFGTAKNMELAHVKAYQTDSTPLFEYPLSEGVGTTVHDISGNGNDGTIVNASTATEGAGFWAGRIDGEANAHNINNGFSKRVFFDVGGKIDLSTPMTNDITSWTLTWRLPTDRPSSGTTFLFGGDTTRNVVLSKNNNNLVGFRGSDTSYYEFNGAGNSSSVNSLLAGTYVMSADGTNIYLWYNGVYKGYITPATTELRVSRYGLGYSTTSLGFEGILADTGGWDTYTSDGTVVIGDAKFYHKLDDITGTTVPDSSDSGNNGVASGLLSPRIPAQAAANPTLGGSNRMLFDGVDDHVMTSKLITGGEAVSISGSYNPTLPNSKTIISCGGYSGSVKGFALVQLNGGAIALFTSDGTTASITNKFTASVIIGGKNSFTLTWDGGNTQATLTLNGVDYTSSENMKSWTGDSGDELQIGSYNSGNTARFSGAIWGITWAGVASYAGNGNTDADWTDQSGNGNNGTVNGSPALLINPDPTLDVYGNTLTNPAVANSHNGAETTQDVYNIGTGDVPCPESNSNSGLSAIAFDADLTADDSAYMHLSTSVLNDRLIAFSEDLTGGDKTLAEKYTE